MLQHPVPAEHLKQIGDITVSFSYLEMALQSLAGSLINEHQKICQIITAELSIKQIRALVIGLYIERFGRDDNLVYLRTLMNKVTKVTAERNQIVHSVWGAGGGPGTITRMKTTVKENHGLRFNWQSVKADDLYVIATDIKESAEQVDRFHIQLVKSQA
jgi:hypothetical protein